MTFMIAEIGINHNGSLDVAKKLVTMAKNTGCDAVKFQKRTVSIVYTKSELEGLRDLVTTIRKIPKVIGKENKKIFDIEIETAKKLRYWEKK